MQTPDAAKAGQFLIGNALKVNRMGFGAMRIVGQGVWGAPEDRDEVLRTLRRLPALGIQLIDTAEAYGPHLSEELLREALHPYKNLLIATKAGLVRPGPNVWEMDARPEALQRGLEGSLKRLDLPHIDLWQLHRIDPKVPRKAQFEAIRKFRDECLIKHVGLSEVSVADIEEAQKYFPVATVQNRYDPTARGSDTVLDYCEKQRIGFIPWAPLGGGSLAKNPHTLAKKYNATPGQLNLAWLLKRSPVMLPIPGTGKVKHLEENTAATDISLSDADYKALLQ